MTMTKAFAALATATLLLLTSTHANAASSSSSSPPLRQDVGSIVDPNESGAVPAVSSLVDTALADTSEPMLLGAPHNAALAAANNEGEVSASFVCVSSLRCVRRVIGPLRLRHCCSIVRLSR
jgi:hypothetical protein